MMFGEEAITITSYSDLHEKYRVESLRNAFTRIKRPANSCVVAINGIGMLSVKIFSDSRLFLHESMLKPKIEDD
jgi:hypothetical protein